MLQPTVQSFFLHSLVRLHLPTSLCHPDVDPKVLLHIIEYNVCNIPGSVEQTTLVEDF